MSYKLIVFVPELDSSLIDYTNIQIQEITNLFPDLQIEQVFTTDPRLVQYFKNPNRVPSYLILKNNVRKGMLQLKVDLNAFTDWIRTNLS
jgi:hypothetical protein